MSVPAESEAIAASNVQMRLPMATVENVAEELRQALNSIQAIAYYVEMTLPLSELSSLDYLRKLQSLVDECHEILQPLARGSAATENLVSAAIQANPDNGICVASVGAGLP